jgi:hypothetical protein
VPKPRPPRKDPAPRCVPVTAKEPPPGWSYYYDRLMRRRVKRDAQLSFATGAAEQEEAMEEAEADVLGTCTGDEF